MTPRRRYVLPSGDSADFLTKVNTLRSKEKTLEKDGLLLMFQIDHLSGEELGWILETGRISGLRNRQLIPTLTKKGRPGYILLLDIDPELEVEAVQTVSEYLPVFGYHRLGTQHVFTKGTSRVVTAVIKAYRRTIEAPIHIRLFSFSKGIRHFFIESDDLSILHRRIRDELKVEVSPFELKQRLTFLFKEFPKKRIELEI